MRIGFSVLTGCPSILLRTLVLIPLSLIPACGEDSIVPKHTCWNGVEELFPSGSPVRSPADVEAVFHLYVSYVDTTDAEFPEGATEVEYLSSAYFWEWEGKRYWQIEHRAYLPTYARWFRRRLIYVDEDGTVVLPRGCI